MTGPGQATPLLQPGRPDTCAAADRDRLDQDLLEAFVTCRDEGAIEALVRRHGPMVLGVCRRLLQNHHDAEDAFQATFLVLARKAASVQPRHLVGNWLYGVAYRTALEARTVRSKRLSRQRVLAGLPEAAARPAAVASDLQQALDVELQHLPDHYRAAIVLCDLEGKTQSEAARQLRCPPGTVACRLTRGRSLLAKRLRRHGLALTSGALVLALVSAEASAAVRTSLVTSTVKAASAVAAGASAGSVVSARVAELSHRVLSRWLFAKLRIALALITVAVLLAAGLLALPPLLARQPVETPVAAAPPVAEDWGLPWEDEPADVAEDIGSAMGRMPSAIESREDSGVGFLPGDAGEWNQATGADPPKQPVPDKRVHLTRPNVPAAIASPAHRLPPPRVPGRPEPGPNPGARPGIPPPGGTVPRPTPRSR